jgi:O-antigen biosynthesis protein
MTEDRFQNSYFYHNVNDLVLKWYEGEQRVLDIGCGTGMLAMEIKKKNHKSVITGLDISEKAKPYAEKNLDVFYQVDLDKEDDFPNITENFDLIILGDVLEHVKRPDILLKKLNHYLNSDGKIIISIPNVAHWSIRLDLLMGKFNYQHTGILDNSHIRFFTYQSICELIVDSGYKILKFNSNKYPIPRISIQNIFFLLLLWIIVWYNHYVNRISQKDHEWEAIQFIFKIEKA